MGARARHACLVAAACLSAALAACGESTDSSPAQASRAPVPAPHVSLSAAERKLWAPLPPDRSAVPVLLYRSVAPRAFARQMVLLDHARYDTITLDQFVRFIRREQVSLPPRPLLLTFDGGRVDPWIGSDAILAEHGFSAVVFVDAGRVAARKRAYLTWKELDALERGGRWDVQLQSGTGNHQIQYGPTPEDVGPFYAYRGSEERIDGWRERVFSDISWGEEQLAVRVSGYRPLAFAPPYGNYGQAGTNDPRIPRLLLARLMESFEVVFTQDRSGFAAPRGRTGPYGRVEVSPEVSEEELHELLANSAEQRVDPAPRP
jgi:peptidoglycan/xylan/chitin deacetylase (PgdA/CDA1 family)